jgi:SAM-dependent methyltransferase
MRSGPASWHARHVPHDEALSRSFYATLGADGLRRRTKPQWDAAITDALAAYLGNRERVLDAGCGYGRIAIPLAARGYRVSGLDLSAPLLLSAREAALTHGVRLPLVTGSMTRLPFRDVSFDAVICLWSAYYEILDPAAQVRTLAEMYRVLDAGGLAVVEGPLPPAPGAELPADRINWGLVEGLLNPHFMHDRATLSSRCTEAGIAQAEIFIRDWAGRERMIVLFRRLAPGRAVNLLAQDVGVPGVPGGLRGHVRD